MSDLGLFLFSILSNISSSKISPMATFNEAGFEDAIIAACDKNHKDNRQFEDYHTCIFTDGYFVKYGDYDSLWPEIQTQLYVSAYAESLEYTSRPRIPKVLHYFEKEKVWAYLVMERIKLSHSDPDLPQRMLEAVTWLATVPAPDGHVLGPLGGGRIRHRLFKDYTAPFHFQSVQQLEYYVNRVRPCLHLLEEHPPSANTNV
jgi:hypothetical protein